MRRLLFLAFLLVPSLAAAQEEPPAPPAEPKPEEPAPEAKPAEPQPEPAPAANADVAAEAPKPPSNVNAHVSLEVGAYQDTAAVSVLTPAIGGRVENPVAGWGLDAHYLIDVVTAASPDIVSTASPRWNEVRHAGSIGARYKPGTFGAALGVTTSYTPDYLSLAANGQLIEELDEKNLTLTESYAYGHDVIGRTGTPFDVFSRQLDYHSFSLGAQRVVNPSLVLGVNADYVFEKGDQSKPYRYVPVFALADAGRVERGAATDNVASLRIQARPLEQLPLSRDRAALTGHMSLRLTSSTIRLEERLYGDTWGLRATTTDLRWLFDVGERFLLWPHLRLHVQNGVDFWQRAYVGTETDLPTYRTGARELSPLENYGFGGGIRVALGKRGRLEDWVLTGTVDGNYTNFDNALYIKTRISALAVVGIEVAF